MKNKEKFAKEIIELVVNDCGTAVVNGELTPCQGTICPKCDLSLAGRCRENFKKWAESEYVEPRYETDWANVPVDTPVLVKGAIDSKRYFNKLLPNGTLALFLNGRTSWSSSIQAGAIGYNSHRRSNVVLAREEDKLKYRKQVK